MVTLTINLLGSFQVLFDGEVIHGFAYDKVRALLAYLALEADRPQRREALADLLWGEQGEKAARDSLRQALATLRSAIGDREADPPFLLSSRETIQFNAAGNYLLDAATFGDLLATCERHRHRRLSSCSACATRLMQAAALYRGELLAGLSSIDSAPFEQWLVGRREMLHRQALGTLFTLADFHEHRGDFALAYRYAARQIVLEPWREEAHCQAMRALALQGERSAALAQYERCRETLAMEFDLLPSPETRRLAEQVAAGVLTIARHARRSSRIPVSQGPMVGREETLAHVCEELGDPDCRLFTIMGPGGIGKTRMAQAVAIQMEMTFADGVAYVSLAPVRTGNELTRAIAEALDFQMTGISTEVEQLLTYLESKEMLLVLDNYEQLLPDVELLQRLAQRAPRVAALVTSRQRLGLSHEWAFDLDGLAFPRAFAEEVERYSAVQLFVQRARQADSRFTLSDAERDAVAHICRLVEGLPLAIELAAAATRYYSCAQIAGRIEARRQVLISSARDVADRQRSVTATFEYSWELLSAEERVIFAGLSVFHGGFDEAAAEAVVGAGAHQLWSLADKSLLRRLGEGRYGVHELLRQFAAEKRRVSAREQAFKRRHLAYFAGLAEAGEQGLRGRGDLVWIEKLAGEKANFNAALTWGMAHEPAGAARLANANWLFWFMHTDLNEGLMWYEAILENSAGTITPWLRARALTGYASMAMGVGDSATVERASVEGLALMRQVGDEEGISLSLHHLSYAASWTGANHGRARRIREEGLEIARNRHDSWLTSVHLHSMAEILQRVGLLDEAERLLEESLTLFDEIGSRWSAAYCGCSLGELRLRQGDYDTAKELFLNALSIGKTYGDRRLLSWSRYCLGRTALVRGQLVEADAFLESAIQLERELGRRENVAELLLLNGDVAAKRGYFERALSLYDQSKQLYETLSDLNGVRAAQEKAEALAQLRAVQ